MSHIARAYLMPRQLLVAAILAAGCAPADYGPPTDYVLAGFPGSFYCSSRSALFRIYEIWFEGDEVAVRRMLARGCREARESLPVYVTKEELEEAREEYSFREEEFPVVQVRPAGQVDDVWVMLSAVFHKDTVARYE